ncbi:MAG: hypothetical protein NFCOHLIN_02838 [Gammaproteobacteria bacterium]|nr:hypothetical protein [Gammaproteobacteria bacterium]
MITRTRSKNHEFGFTLVELAIALVIIGLLLAVVLRATVFVPKAQLKELMSIANQLKVAVSTFKQTYHMLPGDMPNATNEFQNLMGLPNSDDEILGTTDCNYSGGSSGNGLIGDGGSEIDCVMVHLNRAGLIVDGAMAGAILRRYQNEKIKIYVVAFRNSQFGLNAAADARYVLGNQRPQHVVEYRKLPLDFAKEIDRNIDDGILTSGKIQAIDGVSDPSTLIIPLS